MGAGMGVTARWGATAFSPSVQMEKEGLRCFYIL